MEEQQRLKIYCETSFWSYLDGGRTALQHIAIKQAATLQWWQNIAPTCDVFVSQHVRDEAEEGDAQRAKERQFLMRNAFILDGLTDEVGNLAEIIWTMK